MKFAKASDADLNMAMELCGALDSLTSRLCPMVPEKIERLVRDSDSERLDLDDEEQCGRVLRYLLDLAGGASLARVVYGCAVMLDPVNRCVDPDADTIEHHPDTLAGLAARQARPLAEWSEDIGPVLWWTFPLSEPPWCGRPTDDTWPRRHTHWTAPVAPAAPADAPSTKAASTSGSQEREPTPKSVSPESCS